MDRRASAPPLAGEEQIAGDLLSLKFVGHAREMSALPAQPEVYACVRFDFGRAHETGLTCTREYFHGRKPVGSIGKLNAVGVTMRPTAVLPHQAVPQLGHQERRKEELGLRRYQKRNTEYKRAIANPLKEAVNIVNLW